MTTKRVLVIDDDEDICEVIQISLELLVGLEVMIADSGQAGLAIALVEQPDAILLDMMLPDMDGIAVFQALRANPATQQIPVVFLTARVNPVERRWFIESGVPFIAKPFKPKQLVSQFRAALNW